MILLIDMYQFIFCDSLICIDPRNVYSKYFNALDSYSVEFIDFNSYDGVYWYDWVGSGIIGQCHIQFAGHSLAYMEKYGKIYEFHDHFKDPNKFKHDWDNAMKKCKRKHGMNLKGDL